MSEVQSFGSNCHQKSQSRKISIGVMIESSAKKRSGSLKEREVAMPTDAMANCHQRDSMNGAQVTTQAKQTENREQVGSPWITKKSNHEESTLQAASHAKLIRTKANTGGMHDEANRFKAGPSDHSVKLFPKQTSLVQSESFFKGISNGHIGKGEKCANGQIGGKFPCTIAQEPEELTSKIGDKAENTVNGKSEALRVKLWELLGTVSSPNKETHNSQTLGVEGNSLQPEGAAKQASATAVKRRQNSDPIETDSESPDCANKRPVSRSFTQKRVPDRLKQDTVKRGMPAASSQKPGERNIFSFREGWYVGLQGAANGDPSTGNARKKTGRTCSQIEPFKVSVQQKKHEKKSQQLITDKKQIPRTTEKSGSGGSSRDSLRHFKSHFNENNVVHRRPTADKDFPKQMTSEPIRHADVNGPSLPDFQDLREDVGKSSSGNAVDPQCNPESKCTQRNEEIEQDKIPVQLTRNEHRIGQVSHKSKSAPAPEKSDLCGPDANEKGLYGPSSNINRNNIDPRSTDIEKDLIEYPAGDKMDQQEDINSPELQRHQSKGEEEINSPALPGYESQSEDIGNPSFKNLVDPQDGVQSPIFERRSPIASHSLGSRQKETGVQQRALNLVEELMSSGGGIFSFGNFTSNLFPKRSGRDELQDSPPGSPAPQTQENDVQNTLPCSSSEDAGTENSEEGPGTEAFSPETGTAEKPKFMLRRTKRLPSFEGIQHHGCTPGPVSPKVTRENNSMQQPEELNLEEDDGLTRAIAMLALALEKLKSKVKLLTSKRSSEILASVAERIHAQLHSMESQIQTDTCKLATLSKQKRKRLETEFQGQEEQLKKIHTNFKKEIGQLLGDCKGTIEGLEDNHIELKGIVEKQKASHRKLLLQVQEAVESQLYEAEKRITAVNQSAREQMMQLKLVIADCLEGGVLS